MMGPKPGWDIESATTPAQRRLPSRRSLVAIGVAIVVLVVLVFSMGGASAGGLRGNGLSPVNAVVNPDKMPTEIHIAIIADMDQASKVADARKPTWKSVFKTGRLTRAGGKYQLEWLEEFPLSTKHGEAGRGLELSELIRFNGKLYSFDDRTGIMFEIKQTDEGGYHALPRHIIMEGDGETDKGFKIEWAAVKGGLLYVGSFGKEYTDNDGNIKNTNNMWVKTINTKGSLRHHDWSNYYKAMRQQAGAPFPGYLLHEAAVWSPSWKKWLFFPRRYSKEMYAEIPDEKRGTNLMVVVSEDFRTVEIRTVAELIPERGFSSVKEIPMSDGGRTSAVVALRSAEDSRAGTQTTFISVIGFDGRALMEEVEVPGGHKFEGVEIMSTTFAT